MKIVRMEDAISEAKRLAEKLAVKESADEFVEIGEADRFKLYVTSGKIIKEELPISFHENPRDVFMFVLEGEIEFTSERGEKNSESRRMLCSTKTLNVSLVFKKMAIAIEVYKKGL